MAGITGEFNVGEVYKVVAEDGELELLGTVTETDTDTDSVSYTPAEGGKAEPNAALPGDTGGPGDPGGPHH